MTGSSTDDLPKLDEQGALSFTSMDALKAFVPRLRSGVVRAPGNAPPLGDFRLRVRVAGDPRETATAAKVVAASGAEAVILIPGPPAVFLREVDLMCRPADGTGPSLIPTQSSPTPPPPAPTPPLAAPTPPPPDPAPPPPAPTPFVHVMKHAPSSGMDSTLDALVSTPAPHAYVHEVPPPPPPAFVAPPPPPPAFVAPPTPPPAFVAPPPPPAQAFVAPPPPPPAFVAPPPPPPAFVAPPPPPPAFVAPPPQPLPDAPAAPVDALLPSLPDLAHPPPESGVPKPHTSKLEAAGAWGEWHGSTWRVRVHDAAGFTHFLEENTQDAVVSVVHARPLPKGTAVQLEVLQRGNQERLGAASMVAVGEVVPGGDAATAGLKLQVTRVEVGCDEELRRALEGAAVPQPPPGMPAPDEPVVGIDLGTTNSCVAVLDGASPRVLASRLGYNTVPSVVAFDERGLPVTGQAAERRLVTEADRGVSGTKRFMGRPHSDALAELLHTHMGQDIMADARGMAAQRVAGRTLSPIEAGACILADMRQVAEHELKRPVRFAVITVPAYFNDNQRVAVREAGRRAGLDVLRTVNEPTAAAVAYGFKRSEEKTVLVYDLGGGTFDVSILEISGSLYEVKATAGDTFLGGLDFDRLLTDHVQAEIVRQFGMAVTDRVGHERLALALRDAKHALSSTPRANIALPRLRLGSAQNVVDFTTVITREKLEELVTPLIDRTLRVCDEALAAAKLTAAQVGEVLLVGGQTRMPLVRERLQAHFGKAPSKRVNPDEVVALGAALVAGSREHGSAPTLVDVLPVPIGVALPTGVMRPVLVRNQSLPASVTFQLDLVPNKPAILAVFQGDSPRVVDNELLGSCDLMDGETPKAAGKMSVTFDLNSEGLLTIHHPVDGQPEARQVKLTTLQTPAAILNEMGRERVGPARIPTNLGMPVAPRGKTGTVRPPEPPPPPKGMWQRLTGIFKR